MAHRLRHSLQVLTFLCFLLQSPLQLFLLVLSDTKLRQEHGILADRPKRGGDSVFQTHSRSSYFNAAATTLVVLTAAWAV